MISITRIKIEVNHNLKKLAISSIIALLLLITPSVAYAVDYGEGVYGTNVYQATDQAQSGTANGGSSGTLANTGANMIVIASGAAVCVGIGGLLITLRKNRRKQSVDQQ